MVEGERTFDYERAKTVALPEASLHQALSFGSLTAMSASSPHSHPMKQPWQLLDVRDLPVLTKFLATLPGVQPRIAKSWLRDLMVEAVLADKTEFFVGTELVSMAEGSELFVADDWGTDHVSPHGAATLIRLYRAGVLPLKWTKPREVPAEVLSYADSQEALEQKASEREERRRAEAAAYKAKLTDLASVSEGEFSYRLLDDIFWFHIGKGEGTLTIGGLSVDKLLTAYWSNSGKSRDFDVTFTWTSPTQGRQTISKESQFANNRRNDEARNWGLPE